MKYAIILLALLLCIPSFAQAVNNAELEQMAQEDQNDRINDADSLVARDENRRWLLFRIIAEGGVNTPKDKFNAALILQHTGLEYKGEKLVSTSVENYFLAYQYALSAYQSGLQSAKQLVAVTLDRYLWLAYGYQKYGTQTVFVNDKPYWVKIDTATPDEERAEFGIAPLAELLKKQEMLP